MSDIEITLRLPEALVEKARAYGLLDDARMASLLNAELERTAAWRGLDSAMEPARELFRADHPQMIEDDAMRMINSVIDEVRTSIDTGEVEENQ